MDKKVTYGLFILLLLCIEVNAQVTFGNKVTLTGNIDEDRQVVNISSTPTALNQAVNVEVLQTNYLKYANAAGDGNTIEITLTIAPLQYVEGMSIYVKANQNNTGGITLNVNGLGAVPVLKNVTQPLVAGEIISGQIFHVVYDGSSFQLLSDLQKTCPAGFLSVNDSYCIEIDERTPKMFYEAMEACGAIGAKLCDWDEWFYACQHSVVSLGLNNMIGNYEWLDEGGNNWTIALDNFNTAHAIGESGCTNDFTAAIMLDSTGDFNYLSFRCCYKK